MCVDSIFINNPALSAPLHHRPITDCPSVDYECVRVVEDDDVDPCCLKMIMSPDVYATVTEVG